MSAFQYKTRTVENHILSVSRSFPCIALYGARQVGKSTTIHHLFGRTFRSVNLDDAEDRALARKDPKGFLDVYGAPLIIDEFQKVPQLLDEIKRRIDAARLRWMDEGKPQQLLYVLTGSNRFALKEGIVDSLAGRCGIVEMSGFSQAEKAGLAAHPFTTDIPALLDRERSSPVPPRTMPEIFQDIFNGGMPDVVNGTAERTSYMRAYVSTYLEKDVARVISEDSEGTFIDFLSLVALRTAQELHYDEIAKEAGINVQTCKKWLGILQAAGLIYFLQPFFKNPNRRIIKSPKLYWLDTGLCAHLANVPGAEILRGSMLAGAFFETYVVSELVKNLEAFGHEAKRSLFYYRDKDRREIDVIYYDGQSITPIEIKKNPAPKNATRNFSVLEKFEMPVRPGLLINCSDKIRPVGDKAYAFPVWRLGL